MGKKEFDEFETADHLAILWFESIGTMLFTYSILSASGYNHTNSQFQNLAQAFVMGTCVWISSQHTGAHFNPAITLNLWLRKQIQVKTCLIYMLGQYIGAFCAAGIYYFMDGHVANILPLSPPTFPPNAIIPIGYAEPTEATFQLRQIIGEIGATWLLNVFINLQVSPQTQLTSNQGQIGPMFVLFFFTSRSLTFVSGSCLNPAIGLMVPLYGAICDTLYWGSFYKFYIYFVGPYVGGLLAALFFEKIYLPRLELAKKLDEQIMNFRNE